jgi:hypothetical protein
MDPTACFEHLAELIQDSEWEEAKEAADDLLTWLGKEGFAPTITGKPLFDKLVAESVCQRIQEW